jgi:pyruvate/2-oxoacid:ferredoxin oxidoreductase alpha subunit
LWPFPVRALARALTGARRLLVVEASAGQLEDEMRLAMSHAGVHWPAPIESVQRYGGALPSHQEIVERVLADSGPPANGARS